MAIQGRLSRGLAAVLIVGLALLGISRGQDGGETRERAVLTTIGRMLPEGHLSRHPLDDAISRRALDDLVEDLDPLKLYFLCPTSSLSRGHGISSTT